MSLQEELKGWARGRMPIGVVGHNCRLLNLHDKQSALHDAAKRRVKDVNTVKSVLLG